MIEEKKCEEGTDSEWLGENLSRRWLSQSVCKIHVCWNKFNVIALKFLILFSICHCCCAGLCLPSHLPLPHLIHSPVPFLPASLLLICFSCHSFTKYCLIPFILWSPCWSTFRAICCDSVHHCP